MKLSWVRALLVTIAMLGASAATMGCDWANVGGPW
jgi:hypothetical protein